MRLVGSVQLFDGTPAQGALVHVYSATDHHVLSDTVDDQGKFRVSLLPGEFRLVAHLRHSNASSYREVSIPTSKPCAIWLPPVSRYHGIVKGPDGHPVRDASVQLFNPGDIASSRLTPGYASKFEVKTLDDGSFSIDNLRANTAAASSNYILVVTHPKFERLSRVIPEPELQAASPDALTLRPARNVMLRGVVVSGQNRPVDSARVSLDYRDKRGSLSLGHAHSGMSGRFELEIASDKALTDGAKSHQGQFELSVLRAGFSHTTQILVGWPTATKPIRVILKDGYRLAGTVMDNQGNRLEKVRLFLMRKDQGVPLSETVTDKHGSFMFDILGQEEYWLRAEPPTASHYREPTLVREGITGTERLAEIDLVFSRR